LEGIPVVNASICTEGYQPTNEAIIWKL
jgi:hypothetical protein